MNQHQLNRLPQWAQEYIGNLLSELHRAEYRLASAQQRAATAHEKARCLLGALLRIDAEPASAKDIAGEAIEAYCSGRLLRRPSAWRQICDLAPVGRAVEMARDATGGLQTR